jgi:hypothetical protein
MFPVESVRVSTNGAIYPNTINAQVVRHETHVQGAGCFTSYTDGRVRVVFADRTLLEMDAAGACPRRHGRCRGQVETHLPAPLRYCDQKVANREIRVWHFVIEKGY